MGIFNMEYHSHSITILDGRSGTSHHQQCHRMNIYSFLLQQHSTTPTEPARRNIIWSLCAHLKWHFWKRTHTRRWRLWEWKWELKYSHSPQKSTTDIPQFHEWNLSFNLTTSLTTAEEHPEHSPWRFRTHSPVCCHLVFTSSDEESPIRTSDPYLWHPSIPDSSPLHGRAEPPLPVQHHMNYHHTSTPSTDDSFQDATVEEEDFPMAPLNDTIWLEDPVPDRHTCIHQQSEPHFQCSYPCPYHLHLPHSSPEDAPASYYKMMDISDISDLHDVMTTTSDEDIPDLEDVCGLWIWTMVCITIHTPWTLSKWAHVEWYNIQCTQHDGICL